MFGHNHSPSTTMAICGGLSLIPAAIDFVGVDADEGWAMWYPAFGVVAAGCFIMGGWKGPEDGKPFTIVALVLGILQIIVVGFIGFFTVVFSTACDVIDQYDNQCNFYDDNGNMLASCTMSSSWDTKTICEANGCAWGTQHQTDFCSHVGMLALNSVARFILILICLICACMGVCCYTPAPAQAAAPNIIIQTGAPPQPAMVVAQPVAAVAAAKPQPQPVAVVCPQGCMAGSMIEVNINGQQMSVAVPQGVGPGQQFMVNAPTQP